MIVKRELWSGIPLLHVYNEETNEQSPIVIFLHGFLSAKEHNLHYAYQLVQQGVRVILPDALLHGERSETSSEVMMNAHFWKIVLTSVKDVHTIYEQLKVKNYVTNGKIGIAGTSMGGIVTSGCLAVYPWIQTAGICMGTTSFTNLALHQVEDMKQREIDFPMSEQEQSDLLTLLSQFNLEDHVAMWSGKPIIFWHGMRDTVVPYQMSRDFYDGLTDKLLTSITYLSEEKAGHAVSRDGVLQVTQFIAQRLA
ncbi:alpha/beta hydrolase [Solibacillus sp. MA9]|uniref:Alpha/beta hydrolase n=1 Tax=Solibacillus palustris TaxID=2908203 RepID=A0ABS9U8Q1_9BACL|nr:alpha/beta hydrolase [Solibacillus sp. MA9]MCH7320687.1 alpha/beta hydrolase [Solibacillus sp. MA9]